MDEITCTCHDGSDTPFNRVRKARLLLEGVTVDMLGEELSVVYRNGGSRSGPEDAYGHVRSDLRVIRNTGRDLLRGFRAAWVER